MRRLSECKEIVRIGDLWTCRFFVMNQSNLEMGMFPRASEQRVNGRTMDVLTFITTMETNCVVVDKNHEWNRI